MTAVDPDVNLTSPSRPPSLWRNRAFNLLWGSQAISGLGTAMSNLAMPLLTLTVTGSPIQAGVVGTTMAAVRITARLPAGVIADRVDRRRLMLTSDAARLIAYAALAWGVLAGRVTLVWILSTAVIAAMFSVVSEGAHLGAVRNVVPLTQVPDAAARNQARQAVASLAGPPAGGALYGLSRSLPFLADAASYSLSFLGIWLIRRPMQQERTQPRKHPLRELVEGVRFTLGEPFLRAMLLIAAPLNFAFNGLGFVILVILQQRGTPPALIGSVNTMVGAGLLFGAIASPWLVRRVPLRWLLFILSWISVAVTATAALLTGSILIGVPMALAIATTPAVNAAAFGYQVAITPDHMQGKVMAVLETAAMSLASVAALLAGALFDRWGGPATILAFAGVIAISALTATISKGIRKMRPLNELADTA